LSLVVGDGARVSRGGVSGLYRLDPRSRIYLHPQVGPKDEVS